jgi:2-hydroxychromene-2-carboxylate isomerase
VRLRHTEALGRPPDAALRAVLAAIELGRPRSFVERLFAARFDDGDDVTDRAVLIALAERCGMDREALATRMESPETAAALAENDAALRRRGGFALPSMFVGDDLYVGHERLPLVEGALMCAADRPFIAPGEHGRSIDQ